MTDDIERAPRSDRREVQSERLRATVRDAYENVPYYRDRLDAADVTPADDETVDDVTRLPFTTKADFRDQYPDGLFAVDDEEIVHASTPPRGRRANPKSSPTPTTTSRSGTR